MNSFAISRGFDLSFHGAEFALPRRMARDHTKLRTFKVADDLVVDVYRVSRKLPPEERFGLQAQLRRAAVSTPTNIVEGAVRRSEHHYLGYLETSLGSACEARYLLQLCRRLELLDTSICDPLIARYTDVIHGLSALAVGRWLMADG